MVLKVFSVLSLFPISAIIAKFDFALMLKDVLRILTGRVPVALSETP